VITNSNPEQSQALESLVLLGKKRDWSGKRDSNSRPRPWQGRALPAELFPLYLVT
jgi:hypothetical protein